MQLVEPLPELEPWGPGGPPHGDLEATCREFVRAARDRRFVRSHERDVRAGPSSECPDDPARSCATDRRSVLVDIGDRGPRRIT